MFGKSKQVEQSKGDQEESGAGRVDCNFNKVFSVSFLGKETIAQIFEEGEGLTKHRETDCEKEE